VSTRVIGDRMTFEQASAKDFFCRSVRSPGVFGLPARYGRSGWRWTAPEANAGSRSRPIVIFYDRMDEANAKEDVLFVQRRSDRPVAMVITRLRLEA